MAWYFLVNPETFCECLYQEENQIFDLFYVSDRWVNGVFSKLLKVKTEVEGIAYVIELNISQFFSSLNHAGQFLNDSKFS